MVLRYEKWADRWVKDNWYNPFNPRKLVDDRRYDMNHLFILIWMQRMMEGNYYIFGGEYEKVS